MQGKTVIVTGANSGVGKATAAALADRGAHVILACRSEVRGTAAMADLMRQNNARELTLMLVDLSDLDSVRAFATAFLNRFDRLDALVNNAGMLGRRRAVTKQGFEMHFGVNYLGHFLLTLLLLPALERAEQGRIVMTSSIAHAWRSLKFDDLNAEHGYDRFTAYGRSKLCNLLFTRYLAERLKARGSRVTINAVHPGIVATNIVVDRKNNSLSWVAALSRIVLISPEKGADTGVYLVCDPSLSGKSGGYYVRRHIAPSSIESHNLSDAARLYEMSLGFVGLDADPLA